MRIKNITKSDRQCFDMKTGEVLIVKPNEIIERDKIRFEESSFIKIYIEEVEKLEQEIPKLLGKNKLNKRKKENGNK